MNKKLILTSFFAFCAVSPAMAESWPSSGATKDYMKQNTTYTNSATSDHMGVTSGSVNAEPWSTLKAGYYLKKNTYAADTCPVGRYCAGGDTVTYDATNDQGISGPISAGYYAGRGAKTATPTSSSDCVGSGACGKCMTGGYTTAINNGVGAMSYTECYKKNSSMACSSFFPVTIEGALDSVKYYRAESNLRESFIKDANLETTVTGVSYQDTASHALGFTPNAYGRCLVGGVSCSSGYHSGAYTAHGAYSLLGGYYDANAVSEDSGLELTYGDADKTHGTFHVEYSNGVKMTGSWMKAAEKGGGNLGYDSSGSICACKVQTVTFGGANNTKTYPYVSGWFQGVPKTAGTTCGQDCAYAIRNLSAFESTGALTVLDSNNNYMDFTEYRCIVDAGQMLLYPNGATAGTIGTNTITSSTESVLVPCTTNTNIGTQYSWNSTAGQWNNTLTKSNSVFMGWSNSDSCTSSSCLSTDQCGLEDAKYYAVWGTAACNPSTLVSESGVASTSVYGIYNNRVICTKRSKANYYCTVPTSMPNLAGGAPYQLGVAGDPSVDTVQCTACPDGYTSAAGSTTVSACTRTITLNKNGGKGSLNGEGEYANPTFTCSGGGGCTLPDASVLTQEGQTFTGGWGTSRDCTDTTTLIGTAVASTYYACKAVNQITIKWTGVATAGTGFTAVSGETDAYTSEVDYGGNITTPTAARLNSSGQTFLGWKFKKNN